MDGRSGNLVGFGVGRVGFLNLGGRRFEEGLMLVTGRKKREGDGVWEEKGMME